MTLARSAVVVTTLFNAALRAEHYCRTPVAPLRGVPAIPHGAVRYVTIRYGTGTLRYGTVNVQFSGCGTESKEVRTGYDGTQLENCGFRDCPN